MPGKSRLAIFLGSVNGTLLYGKVLERPGGPCFQKKGWVRGPSPGNFFENQKQNG